MCSICRMRTSMNYEICDPHQHIFALTKCKTEVDSLSHCTVQTHQVHGNDEQKSFY